ncbi:MAG: universal stress protein [Thermoanaerobaculia bacterium]
MFTHVLFGTDLSPASERALDCLARWKRFGLTTVTLAHVHDFHSSEGLEERLRLEHEPKMERQRKFLLSRGVQASSRFAVGIPQIDLDRIAQEEGCEAIVVGSHGASWLAEVMMGSIADAVVRHSAFPVFVIKVNKLVDLSEEACEAACTSMFTDVLFPTDLSDETEGAVALVERLCRNHKSTVRLLHVIEQRGLGHLASDGHVTETVAQEQLGALAARLVAVGASSVLVDIIHGHTTDAILHEIEARKPGLVVVGKHGRGHLAEMLLGSTSHALARSSAAPVVIVPRSLRGADLASASTAGSGESRGSHHA